MVWSICNVCHILFSGGWKNVPYCFLCCCHINYSSLWFGEWLFHVDKKSPLIYCMHYSLNNQNLLETCKTDGWAEHTLHFCVRITKIAHWTIPVTKTFLKLFMNTIQHDLSCHSSKQYNGFLKKGRNETAGIFSHVEWRDFLLTCKVKSPTLKRIIQVQKWVINCSEKRPHYSLCGLPAILNTTKRHAIIHPGKKRIMF